MFGSLVRWALWGVGVLSVPPLNRLRVGAVRGSCTLMGYESVRVGGAVRVGDTVATSQFVGVRRKVTFGLS